MDIKGSGSKPSDFDFTRRELLKRTAATGGAGAAPAATFMRALGETRVRRIGGMIGGIGMALMEYAVVNTHNGRVPNANCAEYAVTVHADTPSVMDVLFVEENDPHVNPLGMEGGGEIAMGGVAPAITDAIFHATGQCIRELPVTPDKLH
jgi:hypothetical protein